MSRIDPGTKVQTLQGKKLFGEIPVLGGVANKPQRLTDQIDLIREKAYQDGYHAGYENGNRIGLAEGRKTGFEQAQLESNQVRARETSQFFADLDLIHQHLDQSVEAWFQLSETMLTNMAMDVVKRIIATELQINNEVALGICREVLQHITHAKQARIHINPSDYAMFESHREELIRQSRELKEIEIVEDPTVKTGVMVETDAGIIDATVETRLELVQTEFDQAA